MLTKTVVPKTKAELIAAIQRATIQTVRVYEGNALRYLPDKEALRRANNTVVVLGSR